MDTASPLVSTTWLFENVDNPNLILLDVTLKSPVKTELIIEDKIIPNALRFDLEKFKGSFHAKQFAKVAQQLGINNNSLLVIYDRMGIYSGPKVWWMFKVIGFKNCYVLDGGLPEWIKMGYKYVMKYDEPKQKGDFIAKYTNKLIASQDDVLKALHDKNKHIIDARNADRFYGRTAEPRAGLRSGHIPDSLNIPFEDVLFENKMRSRKELEKIFENIVDKNTLLIFSCGSGVTACITALAATLIGYKNVSVYEGSWSEWGADLNSPIA